MKNDKMGPVQGFAFGGIANPTQRATLRSSDRSYLEARGKELEAFERQRKAYNDALTKYQAEVYNPYERQVKEYEEAVNAWNAGPRDQDYSGPAAPTLPSQFEMTAPVLPFKEAEVAARQKQAAQTARKDAGNRAVAIDVVSDPKKFGFSSFALSDRFMAEGGEVRGYAEGGEVEDDEEGVGEVGSAAQLLAQLEAQGPRSKKKAAPALKRMATGGRGGSSMPKVMDMSPESLASTRELVAMAADKGTAKEQMQELARLYQLRAATFSQPTLVGQTFNKNTLATKRFAGGGEVSGVPSNGFVTGRPIEFSGSPYSQYTTDFVTAKPMKIPAPTYLASYGSQSGEVVDPNPEWSRLTNEQKTQYYQERPKEAALARAGQALFGLTSAGNLQRMFAPEFVREQEKVVGGPLFNRAGLASGFSNFFMGAPQSPAPVIDMSTVREPAPIESVPRSTAPVIDMSTVREPAPIQSGPTTDQGTGYASDYGTASYGGEQYGDMPAGTYAEGGEVKKGKALPTVMEVRGYATEASERLFPDQGGQDDQRDAARHMLAGAALARRYGPNVAKLLGLAHEYSSNPQTFFSGLGIGQPRDDFEYDEHNNRVGMGLASRATSREALEALVREMAAKSSTEKREGLPYIMSQEKMDARAAKAAKGPAPRPQGYQKGGEAISDPEAALFEGRDDVPATRMTNKEFLEQALAGVGDLPYVVAGAPVDLAAMGMAPFGYKDDKPFMGSADIKDRMTRAGIRPADTEEERLKGPRAAAELLASLINPAAATRGAAIAVERGARGAGDAARRLEDATVGSVQRARIRSAADKVPPDTAYDPLRERMEASGNLALAVRSSKIKDLMEAVRDQKGDYGARRVERAADEIPNLEELFEKRALEGVFTGDNAQALITLKPADFEQYALELVKNRKSDVEPSFSGVPDKYTTTTEQYVDYLSRLPGGFKDVPYLNLYKDEVGLPVKPEVKGHEGRHRNRALAERGERTSLVQISPRGDLREGLPRRTQEEYIEALKEELERSGRLVLPERQGPSSPFRPAIKLPDVYAKGGPVDKNTAFIKAHS